MAEALPTTSAGSTGRVRLISTRQAPDDPGVQVKPEAPVSRPSNPVFLQQMLAVMTAIAALLAVRFLLLLTALGAFFLAFLTIQNPDGMKLAVNAAYDLLVFGPTVYLHITKG